ncbi:uncharacterized protein LOC122318762 [Carya illinoinensis]|uniref:uncharacterized protein LOC122318762 n=1 Tax=Carya illinoinensis TaxID=32201 RepID=UPI001C729C4F|nr:uncharacterized protein LOC122318762 [Carya illinoinensis]
MSKKEALKGENLGRREGDKRWQSIWDLNIQGKVKLFMWRAVKDLLATRSNLVMRRIIDNSKCPICKVDEETISHALWSYPAAADVWAESLKVTQKWKSEETDLLVFWEKMMEKTSREELEEIVMVMRSIWVRRNNFIFEGKFASPSQVIKGAREDLRFFQQIKLKVRQGNDTCSDRRDVRWNRPKELSVKANWDAAVDKKERNVGIGVVIRDEEGEILVATREHMSYVTDGAIAESFALRKAMEVCRDLNFNNILFEGDAQNIVNVVNVETKDMTRYGSVIEDVNSLLKGREKWSVSFVFREANEAAHVLAREALLFHSEIVWIEKVPDCIRSIIVKEKSCSENIIQ